MITHTIEAAATMTNVQIMFGEDLSSRVAEAMNDNQISSHALGGIKEVDDDADSETIVALNTLFIDTL